MVVHDNPAQPTEVQSLFPRALAEHLTDGSRPERLLDPVAEACELLGGISVSFLYELMARGELQSVSLGRRRMILRASLVEFVERRAAEAAV